MRKKIKIESRGERWGMKAAYYCKWFFRKLKSWDSACVSKAKAMNIPAWVGHIPLLLFLASTITISVISLLITIALMILFFFITLVLSGELRWKNGHYEMDGYHYPDGDIDHNDR
ncbi:hypothetical protein KKI90_01685 [Xenorhabdus bovienii]|uniref:hypothetical protein n=1 Tax=Xenorhabdus bovienii TaxID=40576 RepID=UPI00237CE9EF|nr:hypothetical protein [Xenorhabdus bovienii]MDE1485165.1 hypothetical protein [Xenorhabdus bovienii]MDE9447851.1 hypothetical protein [Xenorhabdus bovienii]MDE9477988.1 hypothetical protein [Xenorhabdus bovienii]MDE9492881.1 hypothetical protein [Xenorhabdus bovienii]MDE9501320.1 hypothetical protein [Xenorhabdus bovienii]